LQGAIFIVIQEIEDLLREYWRLNETHISPYANGVQITTPSPHLHQESG